MRSLSPAAREQLDKIAGQHGVSSDTALMLLQALAAGGGTMAQFSHPELGGMGQWSQGGMVMVGDMFNQGLRYRVDALCTELAAMLHDSGPFLPSQGQTSVALGGAWWPAELGSPVASGGQNDMRYAYFPQHHRLAVLERGALQVYDTGEHSISGVSQQQSAEQSLSFSSDHGTIRLADLTQVNSSINTSLAPQPPAPEYPPAPPQQAAARFVSSDPVPPPALPRQVVAPVSASDPLDLLERLAALRQKGVLSEEEFAAKKAELLGRV
jgi:hypothetical protein